MAGGQLVSTILKRYRYSGELPRAVAVGRQGTANGWTGVGVDYLSRI